MNKLMLFAGVLAIGASFQVCSAVPHGGAEKAPDVDPLVVDVVRDNYFRSAQCERYLSDLTMLERNWLVDNSYLLEVEDLLIYVEGGDSLSSRLESEINTQGYAFNPALVDARKEFKDSPSLLNSYSDDIYSADKIAPVAEGYRAIVMNKKEGGEQRNNIMRYTYCRVAAISTGMGMYANHFEKYVSFVQARIKKAQIGYFEVAVDKSEYGEKVGTGNQFAEPKAWDGSRFFIVHASFKNVDTESRLPVEGSLFINYNGKEYEFDSIEPISLRGYNIWFNKINPLVTMKTKIVYRIPNEIHGEVFWRPGRNASDTRLWLGFLEAVQK